MFRSTVNIIEEEILRRTTFNFSILSVRSRSLRTFVIQFWPFCSFPYALVILGKLTPGSNPGDKGLFQLFLGRKGELSSVYPTSVSTLFTSYVSHCWARFHVPLRFHGAPSLGKTHFQRRQLIRNQWGGLTFICEPLRWMKSWP